MWADVLLHWCLDMAGGATMWCIVRGCQNSAHDHRPVARWLGQHPWVVQSFLALLLACVTVRMIG